MGSCGNLGVGCFVPISGYFGVKNSTRKFLYITWLTTLYAVLSSWANNGFHLDRSIILLMLVSATETVLLEFGQCLTNFIYAYLICRYISMHQNTYITRRACVAIIIITVMLMFMIKSAGMFLPLLNEISITSNNSPLVLVATVCVLYLFKTFDFRSSVIN